MSINPGSRIACVLVGLPGTSKTLVAQKVCRYLQWLGITSKVFNVGNYRRKLVGAAQPHLFFDPSNTEGHRARTEASQAALAEMLAWFTSQDEDLATGALVAILDATNATRARRSAIQSQCEQNNIQVMFVESSYLENEAWRFANATEMQQSSPDYAHLDSERALSDYKARVSYYERDYEPMTVEKDRDLTFIKLIDAGSQVIINQIRGYLQSRVVYFLMNLRIPPRNIYFSRHGESLFNVMGLLGGDSDLSARGKQYARALPSLVATHVVDADRLTVWTSTKKRTIATAKHLPYSKLAWKALDELEAGKADGLTYEQVEERFPDDFANRDNDKFNYRYQEGESYRDVVARLEPVIMDLERQTDILVIGHQAILRCLYAYFMNYSYERLPYIKIPLHTLIQLTPGAYKCEEKRFKVDIEAVDTHRPKPKASAANGADIHEHPHHDDPLVDATPTVLPSTASESLDSSKDNHHTKTLQSAASADAPRIIYSSLTTHTFRDSIHTTAEPVVYKNPLITLPEVSLQASTSTPVAHVRSNPNPKSNAAMLATPPTSLKHEAPSSILLPSTEERTKRVAEALMQANASKSKASPEVALNLDEAMTPVPEKKTSGHRRPILGLDIRSFGGSNSSNSIKSDGSSTVRSGSLDTVATPPMSPVPSKNDNGKRTAENQNGTDRVESKKGDRTSFRLSVNARKLAAACVTLLSPR